MKPRSLRLRLLAYAALGISIVLGGAGLATFIQFQKYARSLVINQLDGHLVEVLAGLDLDQDGRPIVEGNLSDPRFSKPYSGLYWQVNIDGKEPARSRSLWDETLRPPVDHAPGGIVEFVGPNEVNLIGIDRVVDVPAIDATSSQAVVTVALDASLVTSVQDSFTRDILAGLGLVYVALLGGSMAQVIFGLKPLRAIREQIKQINSGTAQRVRTEHPNEVMPLIAALNELLESRENQLDRARQRAGNLAHGLKTPLTIMNALADELNDKGEQKLAEELSANANMMRNLVDRELARARTSAELQSASTDLHEVVSKIFVAMQHLKQKGVSLENKVEPTANINMEKGDAFELVGNLIDNARRYANSLIRVTGSAQTLIVEDDGHGVPPEKLEHILKRGIKLDSKGGTGLGLAIVSDLADAYGFGLSLSHSSLGGLKVTLDWSHPTRIAQT
jgi:signal transduction histidine kinase